jgi:hypothetical protein
VLKLDIYQVKPMTMLLFQIYSDFTVYMYFVYVVDFIDVLSLIMITTEADFHIGVSLKHTLSSLVRFSSDLIKYVHRYPILSFL